MTTIRYPDLPILNEDWELESDDGQTVMQASDGSWKTHLTFAVVAKRYTFTHPHLTNAQFNSLMQFYDFNMGKRFLFDSPIDGEEQIMTFARRPQVVEMLPRRRSVQIELVGEPYDG